MTGIIFKIETNKIAELLSLDFYIERENAITIYKEALVRALKDGTTEYYAIIDADRLGRGNLMCRAHFIEKLCPSGARSVLVSGFTGYIIPCMGGGNTISCGDYEVTFKKVDSIDADDAVTAGDILRQMLTAIVALREDVSKIRERLEGGGTPDAPDDGNVVTATVDGDNLILGGAVTVDGDNLILEGSNVVVEETENGMFNLKIN